MEDNAVVVLGAVGAAVAVGNGDVVFTHLQSIAGANLCCALLFLLDPSICLR